MYGNFERFPDFPEKYVPLFGVTVSYFMTIVLLVEMVDSFWMGWWDVLLDVFFVG